MDDEIDIEEHDVFDNPAIKSVFPDISVLKKEIEYFEEDSYIEEEPQTVETGHNQLSEPFNHQFNLGCPGDYQDENNKLILDTTLMTNTIDLGENNNEKLDFCSKPKTDTNYDTEDIYNTTEPKGANAKHMKVILQDIKSYLNKNGRYCKLCCRLFLSKHAFNVHKNKVHSSKSSKASRNKYSVISRHKCIKCGSYFSSRYNLWRHFKNIHTEQTQITNSNPINQPYKCNICNIYFKYNSSLKRHCGSKHQTNSISKEANSIDLIFEAYLKSEKKTNIESITQDDDLVPPSNKKRKLATTKNNSNSTAAVQRFNDSATEVKHEVETVSTVNNCETQKDSSKTNIKTETVIYKNKQKIKISLKDKEAAFAKDKLHPDNKVETAIEQNIEVVKNGSHKSTDKDEVASIKEDTSKYVTEHQETNRCLHCNNVFADQKSLIDHMYQILKPGKSLVDSNKNDDIDTKKSDDNDTKKDDANDTKKYDDNDTNKDDVSDTNKSDDNDTTKCDDNDMKKSDDNERKKCDNTKKTDETLFVCHQCSYYLPNIEAYFSHMIRNHKTEKFLEPKKEEFNTQCKYCPYKCSSIILHNRHIYSYHIDLMLHKIENETDNENRNKIFDKVSNFALETVLFECHKCNICFLSSNNAKNHDLHAELLSNWKCSICNHILKEQDRDMHLKQHTFSQPLKVLNLNETNCNVLYNCTKCAIHFTEKRYQDHYSNCESETTYSSYCAACDILVDKEEMIYHKTQHDQLANDSDFTIIDSNIIVDTALCPKNGLHIESKVRPKKGLFDPHNCFTFCYNCKSFINNLGKRHKSHTNGSCFKNAKYTCEECGLVFTNSVLEIHKKRHEKEKKLCLQDYKFFDFQGKQVRPPIPEYPHCKICGIHFLRKKAIPSHICHETDYLTCDVCNLKLSETAFKIHMSFHSYVLQKTASLKISDQTPKTLEPLSKDPEPSPEEKTPKHKISSNLEPKIKTNMKLSKINPAKMKVVSTAKNIEAVTNIKQSTDLNNEEPNTGETVIDDSLVVLYTCKTCTVSFESYDEVIRHCQTHFSADNQKASVKKCKQCSLNLYCRSYANHQRRVHTGVHKIQVLRFDPSYFTFKNMVWVNHIFQSLPEKVVKEILEKSIYQHEHRIQLKSIQKGSSHVYVYKCDECGNYIDSGCVYDHAQNPCDSVRPYPCSICGLPFNSSLSCNNHENLHKVIRGLTKKSLNIILFKQSTDTPFNNRIFCKTNQYILYQCRNCAGVTEKSMLKNHICDRNILIKCITCGLMLCKDNYKEHVSKHADLGNFNSENFKVILFGINKNDEIITPSFSGTVYDYSIYQCEICKICLKNHENKEKHTCIPNFDLDRSKCSECDLYFRSCNLKNHLKQHESDTDFIKENIHVITINGKYAAQPNGSNNMINNHTTSVKENLIEKDKLTTEDTITIDDDEKKCFHGSNESGNSTDYSMTIIENDKEKRFNGGFKNIDKAKICNLMEIDKQSVYDNDKSFLYEDAKGPITSKKENCNDNEDYSITVDCGQQNKVNNDIMEENSVDDDEDDDSTIDDESTSIADKSLGILYKCACGLHFISKQKIMGHIKKCQPKTKQYRQNCSKCHLLFNPNELFSHLLIHHKDKRKDFNFKVLEIRNVRN